jgi:hypothetical protein
MAASPPSRQSNEWQRWQSRHFANGIAGSTIGIAQRL